MSTWLTALLQRIGAIIKRKQKERRAEAARLAQKEAEGDYSHLKNKKGELIAQPLPQPTLPNLSVDDDDASSMNTRVAPSMHTKEYNYYNDNKADYPPMPAYNAYAGHQGPPGAYAQYNPSSASVGGYDDPNYPPPPQHLYDNDNESQVHLAAAAAPFAQDPVDRQGSPYYDPRDVYQGRAPSTAPHQQYGRSPAPPPGQAPGYDDGYYVQQPAYGAPQGESPYGQAPARGRTYDEEIGGYGRGQGGRSQPL